LTSAELAQGFHGVVPRVRLRARFRVGLALVALATLMLPVLYLALVALMGTAYPFQHASESLSVSTFVVRGLPVSDGVGGDTVVHCGQLLRRLQDLHMRVLGRLAVLADLIERALEGAG